MTVYVVRLPGPLPTGVTYLDLETVKVPTPDGYRMPSGEALKRRWRVAMAGVAEGNSIVLGYFPDEMVQLDWLGKVLGRATEVRYSATREFDEMICRGRFTNARRAHLPEPTFPAVPGAEFLPWRGVRSSPYERRGSDVPSRDVPEALADGRGKAVLVHLLRDVCELLLADDRTPKATRTWCRVVLESYDFAERRIHFVG